MAAGSALRSAGRRVAPQDACHILRRVKIRRMLLHYPAVHDDRPWLALALAGYVLCLLKGHRTAYAVRTQPTSFRRSIGWPCLVLPGAAHSRSR